MFENSTSHQLGAILFPYFFKFRTGRLLGHACVLGHDRLFTGKRSVPKTLRGLLHDKQAVSWKSTKGRHTPAPACPTRQRGWPLCVFARLVPQKAAHPAPALLAWSAEAAHPAPALLAWSRTDDSETC